MFEGLISGEWLGAGGAAGGACWMIVRWYINTLKDDLDQKYASLLERFDDQNRWAKERATNAAEDRHRLELQVMRINGDVRDNTQKIGALEAQVRQQSGGDD